MRIFVCAGVCAAVLGSAGAAHAQGTISGGFKAGVAAASLRTTGVPFDASAGAGISAGGFVSVGGRVVRFQPELLFTVRRFTLSDATVSLQIRARAVEIPLLVTVHARPARRAHPFLLAGPTVTFIGTVTQTAGGNRVDISDQIRTVDAGWAFGGGVEIGARRGAVVIDVRLTRGLRDLSVDPGTTFKSRSVMAHLGYRF